MSQFTFKVPHSFLIRGNKLWFSELTSIIIVGVLLISLLTITFIIFSNEVKSHRSDRKIASLRNENIILLNEFDHLQKTTQIAQTLFLFLGKRISQSSIYRLSELVYNSSKQYGYDPVLLLAVIHIESYFKTNAKGKYQSGELSGALGLMQLKFETAQQVALQLELGPITREDLLKPEINIMLGVGYLTQLVKQFKNFKLGLLAYNQGPGTILSNINNKQELSVKYYKKVLKSYYMLKGISNKSLLPQPVLNQ
jgi:hypothetical protein